MSSSPLPSSQKGKGNKSGKSKLRSSFKKKSAKPAKPLPVYSIILFAFAFLIYANTLNHEYVLDDDVVFVKNKDVQAGLGGIKSILGHSFIYGFTGHNDQSYRPVVLITYAIQKSFLGNSPFAGHLINVTLFALACTLLFSLINLLFASHKSLLPNHFAFLVCLLFAAHPIHTEAVANIKGRDDILNFIFLLLSLGSMLRYSFSENKKHLIYSCLFFFLALLCKEMAVTFLALIPLTIFFFTNRSLKNILVDTLPLASVLVLYMLIRNSVLDAVTFTEKMKVVNNALAAATNESDRIATALLILGKYILLLFFPHPLSWDYSFNQIPIVSFSDLPTLVTLTAFVVLGIYSVHAMIKWNKVREVNNSVSASEIYAYAILFFFITMSVVSNIFIMIGSTLGERFLFIPSLAFCMIVPVLLNRFGKNILLASCSVIILLFSIKTFDRNKDWKSNLTLFESGVAATPNSSRAEGALGSAYREMAEMEPDPTKRMDYYQKAIGYYQKSINILPENTEALYNQGVALYSIGKKDEALKVYAQTLAVSPEYTNAANNSGVIYFERQEYELAKKYFLQAVHYDPQNADALGNLGAINHNQGNLNEAIKYYKQALALNPANQNIQNNLSKAEGFLKGSK